MARADLLLATGYRHFLAVAETGSVRAAARQINVAASAISRQLALLEGQLGLQLFERAGRSLTLTAAGRDLRQGLRRVTQGHENTLDQLEGLRGLKRGHLSIATVESISVSILPDVLGCFALTYPGIRLSVTVTGSDAVTELVRNHAVDLGFTFNPASLDGLHCAFALDLPLGAVMAPGHPLAKSRSLTLSQCLEHPVAWPMKGLSLRAILDRKQSLWRGGKAPAFECNSLRLMASLARQGRCIAFQTPVGIEQERAAGELVFVPLSDRGLPVDRLMVVRRAGASGGLAAEALLALAAARLKQRNGVRKKATAK